ncbi:MAG TPA: HD domain-containing protein [Polyangiaceae bacterium]
MTRRELLELIRGDILLARVFDHVARLDQHDAAHGLEHLLRVALGTIRLGANRVDRREAVLAALLHDVVNPPKDHPERALASTRSMLAARELLAGTNLDADAVERIAQAIEDHSHSRGAKPRSALGEALQDADRLEALGALGIARTFSTGARLGAHYFHPDDPWGEHRALDDKRYSVDHFFTKLLALPGTFCTVRGRAEAAERIELLKRFLEALGEEIGSPLPRPAEAGRP